MRKSHKFSPEVIEWAEWLAVQPLDTRARTKTALARVVDCSAAPGRTAFGETQPLDKHAFCAAL